LNHDEIAIVKNSIAKGASDEELQFCLTVARRYKLDPFKQQIWFVKRWDSKADNGHGGTGTNVWTPQVGINGLLFAAGRDHKAEFGSVSLPEYGPINEKTKAPEWARVAVWKKGVAEPTVAEAYWSEYCPEDLSKAPFWRKMPRRMLGKCATALAIRQAYPDLGGLYIPEECARINEEFTPSGRQITPAVPTGGSHEAGQAVAQEKIAKLKGASTAKAEPVKTAPIAKSEPETPPKGILEIDWAEESSPKLFGDLPAEVLEVLKKYVTLTEKDGFYRILPKDVETVRQFCEAANYRLVEHMPQKSSPVSAMSPGSKAAALGGGKDETKAPNTPAAAKKEEPVLVTGIIERVNHTTTANGKVMAYVTILSDKKKFDYSSWDKTINDELEKGKGKVATVFVKISGKYRNLVGLKNVGAKEFIDGKIPVIRKDREPGTKGLYD